MKKKSGNKRRVTIAALGCVLIGAVLGLSACGAYVWPKNTPEKYVNEWGGSDSAFDYGECVKLRIDRDRPIRVLQLTDIHYDDNNNKKDGTRALIADVIQQAIDDGGLDLIAVTGDWVSTSKEKKRARYTKEVFDVIDSFGIPFAPIFGNHDYEGEVSRYDFADLFATYENSLFRTGYSNLKGVGNYIVAVEADGRLTQALFFIDTHRSKVKEDSAVYDCIGKDQIEWYRWSVEGLNAIYKSQGGLQSVIPSMMYTHIPLNEFQTVSENGENTPIYGKNEEGVFAGYKNSGMFDAILAKGSTKAVMAGHDHANYSTYLYRGVYLSYGIESGWCKGYAEDAPKGGSLQAFSPDGKVEYRRYYFDLKGYRYDEEQQ